MSGGTKGGGEVIMQALNLFPNSVQNIREARENKEFLDLLSVYAQMTISESILTPFQTGSVTLNDSNDIMPEFPIGGGNLFHVKYNVAEGEENTEIDLWFRVVGIENVVINERKQAYTLRLISEGGYANMNTVLSSSFAGEPHAIVNRIFNQHLSSSNKRLMAEQSVGGLKFVCPMWKPSQAIRWVTQKALASEKDLPGFFFYESMKGFRFLSTTTLLDKDKNLVITDIMDQVDSERDEGKVKKGYLYKIPGVPVYGSDGTPQSGMVGSETTQNVDDFRVLDRQRLAQDLLNGHISGRHITHDIFHKSYSVDTWNYWEDFDKLQRISKNPHYNAPANYQDLSSNLNVMMSPKQSRIHALKKGEVGYRTIYPDDYALLRKQIMKQLDDEIVENFEAPGNPIIECGRLLEFNYPAIRKVNDAEDVYNKKYSGLYLIRDCMHFFRPVGNTTTSYKVDMNIVKDGWND